MRISKRLAGVLGAAAAVALAIGCSKSSTGPSDPLVGSWRVTVPYLYQVVVGDTGSISPSPFTLTIAKTGANYTATYPTLDFAFTNTTIPILETFDSSAAGLGQFTVTGDNLSISAPSSSSQGCALSIVGTVAGSSGAGGVTENCSGTVTATGTWSATKQ